MGAESRLVEVMLAPEPSLPVDAAGTTQVPAVSTEPAEDLRRLGEALKVRTEDVVNGMVLRTTQSGHVLDDLVEDSFAQVGTVSTVAVARCSRRLCRCCSAAST
jgi:hypothetical protein